MNERTEAQKAAEKRYESKREKVAVKIRLGTDDLSRLDAARGEGSRAAYVERATLEKLENDTDS